MLQAIAMVYALCATPIGGPVKIIDACSVDAACVCEPSNLTQIRYKPETYNAERSCRDRVGREAYETEGLSHEGQMNVHRFSDCMLGK